MSWRLSWPADTLFWHLSVDHNLQKLFTEVEVASDDIYRGRQAARWKTTLATDTEVNNFFSIYWNSEIIYHKSENF